MFAKLPDLLGKNFIIGYLLPAFAFVVLNYAIDEAYNFLPGNIALSYLQTVGLTEQITLLALLSFLTGILLLIFNRDIIVFLEGYGKWNPFKLFKGIELSRFRTLHDKFTDVDQEYGRLEQENKPIPSEIQADYQRFSLQKSRDFPDREEFVLPTAFGNTLRAFETYSLKMYGADAIPIWTRLLAIIPEDYRQFIDTAKTQVDFWVNTWFISLLISVIYLGNLIYSQKLKLILLPFICLLVAYLAAQKARQAAISWGNFVKAAFDLYLGDLQQKLGITINESEPQSDRQMWQNFSQAVIYHAPESMPDRKPPQSDSDES